MLNYKKTILAFSIIFCAMQIQAQVSPSLDDMYTFALCKDSASFKKEAIKKGYHYARTIKVPKSNDYFIECRANKQEADCTANMLTWAFQNKKSGPTNFVSFATTNLNAFSKLLDKVDESGFQQIKQQTGNDEKGDLVLSTFFKFKDTGIGSTISMISTKKRFRGILQVFRKKTDHRKLAL